MGKYLFVAMPRSAVRGQFMDALAPLLLDYGKLFPPSNWHQSMSDRHEGGDTRMQQMLRAGDRVIAKTFTLVFDRIKSRSGERTQWFLESKLPPCEFKLLLNAVSDALRAEGIIDIAGHTAHVTLDYRARATLATRRFEPVHWLIDEFMLVEAQG